MKVKWKETEWKGLTESFKGRDTREKSVESENSMEQVDQSVLKGFGCMERMDEVRLAAGIHKVEVDVGEGGGI